MAENRKIAWFWKWAPKIAVAAVLMILVGNWAVNWHASQNRRTVKRPTPTVVVQSVPIPSAGPTDDERLRAVDVWVSAAETIAKDTNDAEALALVDEMRSRAGIAKPDENGFSLIKPPRSVTPGVLPITSFFPVDMTKNPTWLQLGAAIDPLTLSSDMGTIIVKGDYLMDPRHRGLFVLKLVHLSHVVRIGPAQDISLLQYVHTEFPSQRFMLRLFNRIGGTAYANLVERTTNAFRASAKKQGVRVGDALPDSFVMPADAFDVPFPVVTEYDRLARFGWLCQDAVLRWVEKDYVGTPAAKDAAVEKLFVEIMVRSGSVILQRQANVPKPASPQPI